MSQSSNEAPSQSRHRGQCKPCETLDTVRNTQMCKCRFIAQRAPQLTNAIEFFLRGIFR